MFRTTTAATPPRQPATYGAYTGEIDQWTETNEQEAAEAHAAWTAGQAAIQQ